MDALCAFQTFLMPEWEITLVLQMLNWIHHLLTQGIQSGVRTEDENDVK